MLCKTAVLFVLSLSLAEPARGARGVPAHQISLCMGWDCWKTGPPAAGELQDSVSKKVELDQRFGWGLVEDGECIRLPVFILPCPTFHHPLSG